MTESDARGAARRQFGNPTLQQEEARGTWIARWLADLVQDWVFAVRTIRNQPGFAVVAILSAALGIGACSLIFGIANFALFRSLPVEDPSRLVSVSGSNLRRGRVGSSLAYPDFEDIRHARSFQGMTAFFQFMPATISGNGEPQRYWGSLVTANYFDVVRPAFVVGRGFDAAKDDQKGEAPVVVLSHDLWRSRFGGDATIVGRSIELNRRKVTVVGVTGPGFRGTEAMFFSDYWVPFSMLGSLAEVGMGGERLQDRSGQWLMAAGRLRDGVTEQAAAAEIEVIGKRLSTAYPATNTDRGFHVERAGQVNAGFRKMIVVFFLMLLGVAALVLCTACANVANLLLARASARQKEIATRLAIGAGRGRLVRQLLTESVMLALLGGIAGYAIAHLGAVAIGRSRIPLALPVDFSLSLDYRVMLFSIALATITGVAFGLVPALRATRQDLTGALKDERVSIGQSRRLGLRNLLVVAQVAICMVLLICSSLFVRSLYSAGNIDLGFAHRNVLMMAFDPSLNRYAPGETRRVVDAILENARAIPGVESASLGNSVPLNLEGTQNSFVPGLADKQAAPVRADIYSVAPQFFDTFGIRMIDGEDFRPGVAGRRYCHPQPGGRRQGLSPTESCGAANRLSGEERPDRRAGGHHQVADHRRRAPSVPLLPDCQGRAGQRFAYRHHADIAYARQSGRLHGGSAPVHPEDRSGVGGIRCPNDGDADLAGAVCSARRRLAVRTGGLHGIADFGRGDLWGDQFFGGEADQGNWGPHGDGRRRVQVVGMVLKHGLVLTAAGSAIGLALALVLSRTAASLLYGVSPTDTLTFIVVPVFLLLIALAACLVPARRAASLDPIHALKYE